MIVLVGCRIEPSLILLTHGNGWSRTNIVVFERRSVKYLVGNDEANRDRFVSALLAWLVGNKPAMISSLEFMDQVMVIETDDGPGAEDRRNDEDGSQKVAVVGGSGADDVRCRDDVQPSEETELETVADQRHRILMPTGFLQSEADATMTPSLSGDSNKRPSVAILAVLAVDEYDNILFRDSFSLYKDRRVRLDQIPYMQVKIGEDSEIDASTSIHDLTTQILRQTAEQFREAELRGHQVVLVGKRSSMGAGARPLKVVAWRMTVDIPKIAGGPQKGWRWLAASRLSKIDLAALIDCDQVVIRQALEDVTVWLNASRNTTLSTCRDNRSVVADNTTSGVDESNEIFGDDFVDAGSSDAEADVIEGSDNDSRDGDDSEAPPDLVEQGQSTAPVVRGRAAAATAKDDNDGGSIDEEVSRNLDADNPRKSSVSSEPIIFAASERFPQSIPAAPAADTARLNHRLRRRRGPFVTPVSGFTPAPGVDCDPGIAPDS